MRVECPPLAQSRRQDPGSAWWRGRPCEVASAVRAGLAFRIWLEAYRGRADLPWARDRNTDARLLMAMSAFDLKRTFSFTIICYLHDRHFRFAPSNFSGFPIHWKGTDGATVSFRNQDCGQRTGPECTEALNGFSLVVCQENLGVSLGGLSSARAHDVRS